MYTVWGHSTTTWTKFYPILTPTPLKWTCVDILHPPLCPRGQNMDKNKGTTASQPTLF